MSRFILLRAAVALSIACVSAANLLAQADVPIPKSSAPVKTYPAELLKTGEGAFSQNCGFCHGRDTGGGESGPDLTRSKLVTDDVDGEKIGPVVRNGQNAMPKFAVSDQ